MITRLGGMPLSRSMVLALHNAEVEQAREAKELARARQEREEAQERNLMAYHALHGEWPGDTLYRQAAEADLREQRELARQRQEREDAYRDNLAARMMAGWRPRTHEEILAAARMAS